MIKLCLQSIRAFYALFLIVFLVACSNVPVEIDSVNPVFDNLPTDTTITEGEDIDFLDLGLTASDNIDGDITENIFVDIENTTVLNSGFYTITYMVSDSSENTIMHRIILTVLPAQTDFTPPFIYVEHLFITIEQGTTFDLLGIYMDAYDEVDGDITSDITVNISDTSTLELGQYIATYSVYDSSGNIAKFEVRIYVINFDQETSAEYFTYEVINSNEIKITEYDIDGPKYVVIPKYINGFLVTEIGESAFDSKGLINIIIPDAVTNIEGYAFHNNLLSEVIMPSSLLNVGESAFQFNLEMKSVVFNEGLISIESWAFSYTGIEEIILPESLISIESWGFAYGILKVVYLPDNIETIGNYAFLNNLIEEVILPSNAYFGNFVFMYNNISSVTISEGTTIIKDGTFYYNSISSIIIPSSVVTIGDSAFDSNSLDSITIEGNEFRFNSNWTAIGFPYDLMPVQNE